MSDGVILYNHAGLSDHIQRQYAHQKGFQQDGEDLKSAHTQYTAAVQGAGGDGVSASLSKYISAHQDYTDAAGAYAKTIENAQNSMMQTDQGVHNMFV